MIYRWILSILSDFSHPPLLARAYFNGLAKAAGRMIAWRHP
jgi:hypothetical protein